MKLEDISKEIILDEGATRAFKRFGTEIRKYFRCNSGPKQGNLVSNPALCGQRKDPKKVRTGKRIARTRKGVRIRKTKIAKRTTLSHLVTRLNKRLNN